MKNSDIIYKLAGVRRAHGRVGEIGFRIWWTDEFAIKADSGGEREVFASADENLEARCSYSGDVYRVARFGRLVIELSPEASLHVCKSEQKAISRFDEYEQLMQQDLTLINRRRF